MGRTFLADSFATNTGTYYIKVNLSALFLYGASIYYIVEIKLSLMNTRESNMANQPHPIQYQGSKRGIASTILNFLPKKIERLVEPFAGTAAMSVAASAQRVSQQYWINDLNKPLIQLLELIIEHPYDVVDGYSQVWNEQIGDSIKHYYQIRDKFNTSNDPILFLYLLARCVKGAVRYNNEGLFNQSPDKRRKGTQPEKMFKNIEGVSKLLKGKCVFTSFDYKEVLSQVKSTDFVYMDPPYQGVCGNKDSRYYSGINFDGFVSSLEELNRKDILFAVSYDGKRGNKTFGQNLPKNLNLKRVEIQVGRSSQATLLGKQEITIESLYLSNPLIHHLQDKKIDFYPLHKQLAIIN